MRAAGFGFVVVRVRTGFDSRKEGRGRRRGPFSFSVLIGLLLLAWGAPAAADGYQVRALAYPTLYGPAFETSTLAGADAAGFGGALVADPPFTEVGDPTLEMNSYMTATANARAGAPASGRLEHDVIRGFAEAYAYSDFDLSSSISPYDGVGPTGRLWGAEASAISSMSGVWAIGDPSVSSTIPIKLGFPFMLETVAVGGVAPGGATGAVAAASGAFYVDNTLFYSFDVSQSSLTGRTVYVDGLLASDFAVDGFEYQPGKPLADYLTLAFDAPPGTWRFDLSVSVLSSNGLVPGDTGTAASASATIDPFLIVDPDWEFANLVTFELNSYVDYQGNPLAGGRGESLWADYDSQNVVPEPGTAILMGGGLILLARGRSRVRDLPG